MKVDSKVVPFPPERARPRHHRAVLPREAMPDVACAFCSSADTEPTSVYGCHMLTAQYYCHGCKSTFDWVRGD